MVKMGREGGDGAAREEASIRDTYSAHSWANRAEEGEFIPQAALDLEAEFGGFSANKSFLKESLHGDSSSPSIRGRRSLYNGSHGGHGGRARGAQVARGIQGQKHSFSSFDKATFSDLRSAYVSHSKGLLADSKGGITAIHGGSPMDKASAHSAHELFSSSALCGHEMLPLDVQHGEYPLGNSEMHESDGRPSQEEQKGERYGVPPFSTQLYAAKRGLSLKDQNGEFPLGNRETHGGDGRPTQEKQKGETSGTIPLVRPTLCSKKGLTNKVTNDHYPLGTSGTYERDGRPSQDMQKIDGTATSSSDFGGNGVIANGDHLVGNALNQGNARDTPKRGFFRSNLQQ
ncbi:hypothetical protein F0562_015305 [Nyssa sinensis]|uniref:Uncharacterized protein n=1 Tax=Nyssa sinensis TaxID=561372 RepID=A0A5J4ZH10_9ASTE|nr:hypothetical protein F0562_015305 [Nyssa sinensis]